MNTNYYLYVEESDKILKKRVCSIIVRQNMMGKGHIHMFSFEEKWRFIH